jgi:hypothetical protein
VSAKIIRFPIERTRPSAEAQAMIDAVAMHTDIPVDMDIKEVIREMFKPGGVTELDWFTEEGKK